MSRYLWAKMTLLAVLFCARGVCAPPALQVDGQPYFPLGWYTNASGPSPEAARDYLAVQKAQGMNSALLCYGVPWWSDDFMTNLVRGADMIGMKAMMEVNRYAVQQLDGYPLSLIDHQVDLLKGYPAFMGWYLIDEPELQAPPVTPAMAQARYAQIKARDSADFISVCGGAYSADNYLAAEPPPYCDVLMSDRYPVGENSGEFQGALWLVAKESKHLVDLAQTHGKQACINVIQTHGGWGLRMPTYAEQRYLSYAPVTCGARGLLYWMYEGGFTSEDHKTNIVAPIAREIASLIPAILSNSTAVSVNSDHDNDTTGHSVADVTYLFGEDSVGGYLVAANNTSDSLPVTFQLSGGALAANLGQQSTSVPVVFESRSVTVSPTAIRARWTLTDTFGPYGVHVYRIYRLDSPVRIDLGLPDVSNGMASPQNSDGDTLPVDIGGSNCRRNADPGGTPPDRYFYFAVDDSFAYQGNNTDLFVTIRYYDSGSGSLALQHDGASAAYSDGGSVALSGDGTWKEHTFHLTDAYFGNRQNSGSDFRIMGPPGSVFYIDTVSVTPAIRVTSPECRAYRRLGDVIAIQVRFGQPVFVTGAPQLELETGAVKRRAGYVSGSGTSELVFNYVVQDWDQASDLDYTGRNALTLNGGTIKDAGGSNVSLLLPLPGAGGSLSWNKSLVVGGCPLFVTGVTSSQPNGAYKLGDTIGVQVGFSEPVFVTGTPRLELELGTVDRQIDYISGSGSDTLTFGYTVGFPDSSPDLDYSSADALALNGGTIRDAASLNASLGLADPGMPGSLGHNKDIVVDGVPPTVTGVTSDKPNGLYGLGAQINIQVSFSEVVLVMGAPQLELETGAVDRKADYVSGSGTNTLVFSYTVQSGDVSSDLDYKAAGSLTLNGGTIRDVAGNGANLALPAPGAEGSLGYNKGIAIDSTVSWVTNITSSKADGTYRSGIAIGIRVTFSEVVYVTGSPRLELETGVTDRQAAYAGGTGSPTLVFSYTVQNGDVSPDLDVTGTNALSLNGGTVKDAAGNAANLTLPQPGGIGSLSYNKNLVIDGEPPVVVNVTSLKPNGVYRAGEAISVNVGFQETVLVTGTPQLELETGAVDRKANYTSGSGTGTLVFAYTVQPGDVSADLDYTATTSLSLNGGTIKDVPGNTATLALPAPGSSGSLGANKEVVILGSDGSIASAKQQSLGSMITLGDKVLYLKQGGFGYIEEPNRVSGIRIEGSFDAVDGSLVCLRGALRRTSGGELYLDADLVTPHGPGSVAPLGANNRFLSSSLADGLSVAAWGWVLAEPIGNTFFISDGSDGVGIKVIVDGAPGVSAGDFVTVRGAAGFDGARIIYGR